MHSLSILLPNNRLLNSESQSFSVRQAASNLLSSLKHVQRVLVFHCIRTNRINGSVNQCSEIISVLSFGRNPVVTSRAICKLLLKYFTSGPLELTFVTLHFRHYSTIQAATINRCELSAILGFWTCTDFIIAYFYWCFSLLSTASVWPVYWGFSQVRCWNFYCYDSGYFSRWKLFMY